ncbi:MAG: amidohydrolase family protein [SAR202 cluster bacterium]|nr:amidohydrolase family protein [SAR202 cluster bacterium]|tara:strand:- start:9383 stop:10564 length:1182 start_codon:yes stop_codon:yes gene_type:complete
MSNDQLRKYDLLLKGGRLIDPASDRDGQFDVATSGGHIALVDKDISPNLARTVADVSGLVVTPGLVDLHAHFYGYTASILPDAHCLPEGTTTAVDAGGSGHLTFDDFNEQIIAPAITNVFALLNIAGEGMVGEPEQDLDGMDSELTALKIAQRPDLIVGVKVAHYMGPGWEPLDRGIQAAEENGVYLMVDQSPIHTRPMDEMMLEHLRPGDMVTHCYALSKPMTDIHDKVKPHFIQARERGVQFDVGHGAGSFSFRIAKAAIEQGFLPDTISTDMHRASILANQATMPETMSKLLALGMELPEIIRRSTWDPAQAIGHPELGNLGQTVPADIAVLNITQGEFGLVDNGTDNRVYKSDKRIVCEMTIKNGQIVWDKNGRSRDDWSSTPPTNPAL